MICFFTSDDILIQILPLLICVSPQNGHCPKAPKVLVLYHGEWRTNQSWYIDISNIWYIEIIVVHLQLHILQRQVTWADSNFNADNAFSISGTNQMVTAAQLVTIWWGVWHSLCFNTFWRVSFEQVHQQQVHLLQCLNAELEWWWLDNKQVALLTTCMTWNDVWCMMYDVWCMYDLEWWWLGNKQVALLTTCMTTPDDSDCTINAVSTSLPLLVCWCIICSLSCSFCFCCWYHFFSCSFFYKHFYCPGDKHRQLHDLNRRQ